MLGFSASGSSIRRQTSSSLAPVTHAVERITLGRIDTRSTASASIR